MIIRNLIYILQSENYYLSRFFKFTYSHLSWWRLEKRQKINWTAKARLIYALTLLIVFLIITISFLAHGLYGIFIVFVLFPALPIIISASLLIIKPVDYILKRRIIKKAANILNRNKIIVIGITGSYGKTSAKEILYSILKEKYKTIETPNNINTDIGIAEFILKNCAKLSEADVFIVEMGAYKEGEIKNICEIVNPHYSILTGINESHIERFGSLEKIIRGKFELPEKTKKLSVLNFDDKNIRNNYGKFRIKNYTKVSEKEARDIRVRNNFKGLFFNIGGIEIKTSLLAMHNITLILLCVEIARKLGMQSEEIKTGIAKIKPISHRLEPIFNSSTNIMVIDDSYNGNFNGILSGIDVLKRARGRKIVLTPGLVELGSRTKVIHNKIGSIYAKEASLVLLIKNDRVKYIIEGMENNNFKNYKTYKDTGEAHNDLKNILKSGDTIIFQNDLTDNYF